MSPTTLKAIITSLALLLAAAAQSAVILDDTAVFAQNSGMGSSINLTSSNFSGFNPAGSDKLVVTISNEKQGGGTASISGIFLGTTPLLEAREQFSSVSNQLTAIYYLDNPGALDNGTNDLSIAYSSNMNGIGVSLLALTGTLPGVDVVNSNANGQSTSLTTTIADSFVVASHVNNGSGGTAQPPLMPLLDAAVGSAGGGSGYQFVGLPATITPTFTGSTTRPVTVAAAFAPAPVLNPVPEPSTVALLAFALGGIVVCSRRRRSPA